MSLMGNIEPFQSGGNFTSYEDRVRQFFLINDIVESKKTALFISIAGPEIYEILMTLTKPDLPSAKCFDEIVGLLREHFMPKNNKRVERLKFHKARQHYGEPILEYIIRIKKLSGTCMFADFIPDDGDQLSQLKKQIIDDQLIDKFIAGLYSRRIQQLVIKDEFLTFDQCCEIALNMELVELDDDQSEEVLSTGSSRQSRKPIHYRKSNNFDKCKRCARKHDEQKCPAWEWKCYVCDKFGHTSRVCPESPKRRRSRSNHHSMSDKND